MPIYRKLLAVAVLTGSAAGFPALAQDDVVYPANAPDVSYAELDQLPDFRGLWFPGFGGGGAEQPLLKGDYKTHYEAETAKVAADPNYEILEGPNNCERSEEHTSELQSRPHLVCRLLLEKKKKKT